MIPSIETVQETLDRHAMWKTQPPKSPLSGGLVTQFPPDKGGQGGLGMTNIGFLHSLNCAMVNPTRAVNKLFVVFDL